MLRGRNLRRGDEILVAGLWRIVQSLEPVDNVDYRLAWFTDGSRTLVHVRELFELRMTHILGEEVA